MDADRPAVPGSKWLFMTCFVALIATSFAFMTRILVLGDWASDFGFSEVQKGELLGAGIWPFAISIILFSLVIDRIGYGKAMAFAFACHIASVAVAWVAPTFMVDATAGPEAVAAASASGYRILYIASFLAGLAAGTVEAVINPVIATAYSHAKTKWLNILHAGWAAGLVLAGLLVLAMKADGGLIGGLCEQPIHWKWKIAVLLIPTVLYGVMTLRCKFPVNERVEAGVSYRGMLAEAGALGAFIAFGLVFWQVELVLRGAGCLSSLPANLGTLGSMTIPVAVIPAAVVASLFGLVSFSLGRPLFVFLLLVMVLLATTEIGTDGWIADLMRQPMQQSFGIDGGWVLVYSASIMFLLRVFGGPIIRFLNPVGLLLVSCLFAAAGLMFLSTAAGVTIIFAATIYAIGQTFFWPTTLGLVSERFPRGGALTLNAIAGVGMLGVGILGFPLIGFIQDKTVESELRAQVPAQVESILGDPKASVLGAYRAVDATKVETLGDKRLATLVEQTGSEAKQNAMFYVAALPLIMFVCYLGLWLYFRMNGGYKAEELPVTTEAPRTDTRPV